MTEAGVKLKGRVIGEGNFTAYELVLLSFALSFAIDGPNRPDLKIHYDRLRQRIRQYMKECPYDDHAVLLDDLEVEHD